MNKKEIEQILSEGESKTIEFKEKINNSTYKTLCAFSNTEGGILLIGVSDDKIIKGISYNNNLLERITNKIINKLGIHPNIEILDINGKKIIKIKIEKSTVAISFEGKYYKRIGNTTREMKSNDLKNYFLKNSNWDTLTNNCLISEINKNTIERFLDLAIQCGRLRIVDKNENLETILKKLRLIVNEKLTNSAILLFGNDPQKYFINAIIRVGRFRNETTIIGDKLISGNLFNQIYESETAIKNFINVRYEIKNKLVRENIWDYPLEAIREALLNAIVHRDYFKFNVQTQIKIFDNYLWFFNIGGLPDGITINQLKKSHSSVPRNPLIAHIFYLSGLIEEYGSGIGRMLYSFKKNGLPEPEFEEEFGGFSLYFRKDIFTKEYLKKIGLKERQLKAISYVKENGMINNTVYQEINNVSRITSTRDLKVLVENKVFKIKGTGKRNLHYVLNEAKMKQK